MPLKTTVIGAWPKPDYLALPDWFKSNLVTSKGVNHATYDPREKTKFMQATSEAEIERMIQKARNDVIKKQIDLGLDVVTDGEIERENYIFHFARNLKGIDMQTISTKTIRDGACTMNTPTISSKVMPANDDAMCWIEWEKAQQSLNELLKKQPVARNGETYHPKMKYTIPGPMTLIDVLSDTFYGEKRKREMIQDLITCINKEILALAEHGCTVIQIDEPVLMRKPKEAIAYGIQDVVACMKGLPSNVTQAVHLCCGYPSYLDQDDYKKADKQLYVQLAGLLDSSGIHQISIEDAEACNDLSLLLPQFKQSTVILGVVKCARSKTLSEKNIEARVKEALKYIDGDRLILAPDCGLGFLSDAMITEKLTNMVNVAKSIA